MLILRKSFAYPGHYIFRTINSKSEAAFILINKAGSVYYVYTYKNLWDRELSGEIEMNPWRTKRQKIRFDEAFLWELPEFRNYQVGRKGINFVFTQISEEGMYMSYRFLS